MLASGSSATLNALRMTKTIRIGVDTGGTFTDVLRLDEHGIQVCKVRSTPHDPAQAILTGITELMGESPPSEVIHGSTVATNALLERKGARVALVATKGFEDALRIGRQTRAELYNFQVKPPRSLIADGLTFGIAERMAADASVIELLREEVILELIASLRSLNVDAVAVCLLHSYANPAHERALDAALSEAGFLVSASHQILLEYREFERWSTTAVNAYVTPLMANYLTRLENSLKGTPLRIMQSNGGSISAHRAKATAVHTVLSGPAAGVIGSQAIASASGFARVITFDMGGTSTDVSLIDGAIGMTMESIVGDLPVRIPMLDIHTVGAGGGSIAFIDAGGSLRVGPRSAGADPGPACYGNGGQHLTVTDANLLLGRIDPEYFLGGRMALDTGRARSIARILAAQLNIAELALLEGVVRIANANMVRAIRVVSVERGFDPRDFALLAFGGAGGLHACEMADMLDIATVLIPEHAGVLSALGMLLADATKDYSLTLLKGTAEVTEEDLQVRFAPLVERGFADLAREGFARTDIRAVCTLDMRYHGQAYEIAVPFAPGFEEQFHHMHRKMYGYANPARPMEIVHLRVKAIGRTDKPLLPRKDTTSRQLPKPFAVRPARFRGRTLPTPIYRREALAPGMSCPGPAIVTGAQSTTAIPPGFGFSVDGVGTLVATRMKPQKRKTGATAKEARAD
jgi:N-methylhydantoinase A/oxoprolinase/acetone carboxylase beta subunit